MPGSSSAAPLTSLRFRTTRLPSFTSTVRSLAKLVGSTHVSLELPSDSMRDLPSVAAPHPSWRGVDKGARIVEVVDVVAVALWGLPGQLVQPAQQVGHIFGFANPTVFPIACTPAATCVWGWTTKDCRSLTSLKARPCWPSRHTLLPAGSGRLGNPTAPSTANFSQSITSVCRAKQRLLGCNTEQQRKPGQQCLHGHLFLNLTRPSPKSSLLSIFLRSTLPVCSSTSRTLDWPLRPAESARSTPLEHIPYPCLQRQQAAVGHCWSPAPQHCTVLCTWRWASQCRWTLCHVVHHAWRPAGPPD